MMVFISNGKVHVLYKTLLTTKLSNLKIAAIGRNM